MNSPAKTSALMKTARLIGDLDDDFYRDERQRDVWNEASAFGFQLAQWAALVAAAALPLAGGRTGAWTALGLLIAWVTVSFATIAYARAQQVDIYRDAKTLRPRVVLAICLYAIGVIGIYAQLSTPLDGDPSTWFGMAVGAVVGIGVVVAITAWRKRRDDRRIAEEEALDDTDF